MKGKIEIEAIPDKGIMVSVNIHKASMFDLMGIFEALAEGFKLDEKDRKAVGLMFLMGGIKNMPGVTTAKVEMDEDLLAIYKLMKEKENETDAL